MIVRRSGLTQTAFDCVKNGIAPCKRKVVSFALPG
jgi:hypothetical protein